MTKRIGKRTGYFGMVIYYEMDPRFFCDGGHHLSHPSDFIGRGVFGAELDDIGPSVAQLPSDFGHRASTEVASVNECVEVTFRKRLHCGWRGKDAQHLTASLQLARAALRPTTAR